MKKYTTWFSVLLFYATSLVWNINPATGDGWKVNLEDNTVLMEHLKVGNPSEATTSAGGHAGHYISTQIVSPFAVDVRDHGTLTYGSPSAAQVAANSAAIQAAYDNLVATYGGGRLVFPAQKIIVNPSIKITSSYVTFEGQGDGWLLKNTELSGDGTDNVFVFSVNAVDRVRIRNMIISNSVNGIVIPEGIYISNPILEKVGFVSITSKAINVADNTDYLTGGIVRGTLDHVWFYDTLYGFYSNDRAMVNNLDFIGCDWWGPKAGGIGIRAGDGTYFTVRGGLNNGSPTTDHVPISIGYGYADIDGMQFSDFGHTPGTNDNIPLIQVRASADVSLTKNLGLDIRNSSTLVNYRGPIIAIDPSADIQYVGIHNSRLDAVSGHTTAMDNQAITNASVIDHLTVTDSQYNGSALQEDSPDVTWSGNWGGYQQFWPTNVQRHWSGVALVVDQGGGTLNGNDFGKTFVDTTAASNFTYTLPDTNTAPKGASVSFKKEDTGAGIVTIQRSGADVIDGLTSITLRRAGESVRLISDGAANWYRERDFFKGAATASVTDNTDVSHGIGYAPSVVVCTTSVGGETCSVSAISSTTFTVRLLKHDGTAGTSQTVYWMAK